MPKDLSESNKFIDFVLDPFKDWKPIVDVEINSDDDDDDESDHGIMAKRASLRLFGKSGTKKL